MADTSPARAEATFLDCLGDIADSYINDPGQRRALIADVMEAAAEFERRGAALSSEGAATPVEPSAADPWRVTLCWTPTQNHGAVSVYPNRAPVTAIVGLLRAGETRETICAEHGITPDALEVIAQLVDDIAPAYDEPCDCGCRGVNAGPPGGPR